MGLFSRSKKAPAGAQLTEDRGVAAPRELWTDRADALDELVRRESDGRLDADLVTPTRQFIERGYAILPGAVAAELCDEIARTQASVFRDGHPTLKAQSTDTQEYRFIPEGWDGPGHPRVVDGYVQLESLREALFAPTIVRFLRSVFDDDPLLFQSLSFDTGTQQGIHRDPWYVVTMSALELAATWIALEDIEPGSGELVYIPGSHRLPVYKFDGERVHFDSSLSTADDLGACYSDLMTAADAAGLEREYFRPKKGDVLVWSAMLAHGGGPITHLDPEVTRRSLVGHYCPNRVDPRYFTYQPDRVRTPTTGGYFTTTHY